MQLVAAERGYGWHGGGYRCRATVARPDSAEIHRQRRQAVTLRSCR